MSSGGLRGHVNSYPSYGSYTGRRDNSGGSDHVYNDGQNTRGQNDAQMSGGPGEEWPSNHGQRSPHGPGPHIHGRIGRGTGGLINPYGPGAAIWGRQMAERLPPSLEERIRRANEGAFGKGMKGSGRGIRESRRTGQRQVGDHGGRFGAGGNSALPCGPDGDDIHGNVFGGGTIWDRGHGDSDCPASDKPSGHTGGGNRHDRSSHRDAEEVPKPKGPIMDINGVIWI